MNLIAAVSKNWGLGKENGLLFHIPTDMKFFREKTIGKVVVMGRKTLESFPGKRPLPNRTNIVLTSNPNYSADGVILCRSEQELLEVLTAYDTDDIFICGGASVYRKFKDKCKYAYITKVDADADADCFLDNFDLLKNWQLCEQSDIIQDNGYSFRFACYENIAF